VLLEDKAFEFGQYLKKLRQDKSLTLVELADLTDFSNAYLSQIENGKRGASIELLEKLSEPLGVPLFTLLEKAFEIKNDKKILPERDLHEYNLANLLQNKKVNLNHHELTDEERKKIVELLYVIFPEKRDILISGSEEE
jgi:transcriptional regulator with XRE-family HTH domain